MGKLHICKSTVVDEKSGNSALFFKHLLFQSYHVSHQQELNASELLCCQITTPFEEKPSAFLLYISFEESINFAVYPGVNSLLSYFAIKIVTTFMTS